MEQLFQDIQEAQHSRQDEYFIGLMVFMPENGQRRFRILDGQQRLATTTIILAAVRSWLTARGFGADAQQIQEHYIASRQFGGHSHDPSLVLNETNNDAFNRHVIQESPAAEIQEELAGLRASVNRGRMKNGHEMFHHAGSPLSFPKMEYARARTPTLPHRAHLATV